MATTDCNRRGSWENIAADLAALSGGMYGRGRGPLGLGVTGVGRGFWEQSGDKSRELWGMYTGCRPMPGAAPWTDVRPAVLPAAKLSPREWCTSGR